MNENNSGEDFSETADFPEDEEIIYKKGDAMVGILFPIDCYPADRQLGQLNEWTVPRTGLVIKNVRMSRENEAILSFEEVPGEYEACFFRKI